MTQELLDFSLDIICSFDLHGRFLSATKATRDILGYEPAELIGRSYREFVHPSDYAKTADAVRKIIAGLKLNNFENRYIRKDGTEATLLWSSSLNKEKNIIYGVAKDATQLVQERQKAKASEQRLCRALKLSQVAWWELNAEGEEHIVSNELYQIYGLNKDVHPVFTTNLYLSLVHPDDLPKVKVHMAANRLQDHYKYDHRIIKPSGEVIYVIHYVQSIRDETGKLIQLHGTTKDITERKTAELRLRRSRRTLKTILDSISDGFFAVNREWEVTYWNAKAEELLQKERKNIIGKNIWDEFESAIPLKFYTEYNRAFQENVSVQFEEYFSPLSTWFEVSAYPSSDTLAVYFRDITDKKKQEQALKESNERYEFITKATFDSIWDYDITSGKLQISNGFNSMFGYPSQELKTDNSFWKTNIHPDDLQRVYNQYQDVMKGRETTWFQEFRFMKNNGDYAFVQDKGVIIREENGIAIRLVGALRDITETKYLQTLERLEKEVLETNALTSKSLDDVLKTYITGIEALHPGMYCSMLKKNGNQLFNLSSPNLPYEYSAAIDGIEIGKDKGSCGTAAFLKQRVAVIDIENDIRWADYKYIALHYGLRSCWSQPIIDSNGDVIATFAAYHTTVKSPSGKEENTLDRASYILKIILEHHEKEEALNQSNQRYQYVTKATSDAIWDWDIETNTHYWGEGFTRFFGNELAGKNVPFDYWTESIHPAEQQRVAKGLSDAIHGTAEFWQDEYRFRKLDGSYAEVTDKGYIIRNSSGKAIRIVGALQDITQKKEAERLIQLSEERFRLLFHQSPKPKWIFKQDTFQLVEVNEAALQLYGYRKEEFLKKTVYDLKLPSDHAELDELRRQGLSSYNSIVRHVKKSGEEFYIEIATHAIDLPNGQHFIVIGDDMTEKLELQQKLITEKVNIQKRIGEAVLNAQERERGEIGRELHDNVNQILTSAKLYQELALSGFANQEKLMQLSKELILKAIEENRKLSKRLSAPMLGNTKLSESVEELIAMVQSTNQLTIKADTSAINDLQVEQEIHLAIYRILQEHLTNIQKYAKANCVQILIDFVDDHMVLKITDDGKGFDIRQKSSGIGISNMTMRAESLCGTLSINSAPGLGCVLIVQIPYLKKNHHQLEK